MFGEERRRTKVVPHAFGDKAVDKLMEAGADARSAKYSVDCFQ